jgi:hypothetical protein
LNKKIKKSLISKVFLRVRRNKKTDGDIISTEYLGFYTLFRVREVVFLTI